MITPRRLWNWCRRFRHRCGYGVHSPADFFLITSVIYEKYPYYAYQSLQKRGFSNFLPHYRRKVNRLLFRLVNYLQPETLIEVGFGNGASMSYMRAASRRMNSITMKGRDRTKTVDRFLSELEQCGRLDCLHIAYTDHYREVFEAAMPYITPDSWMIIGGIHTHKERAAWWKQVVADPRTVITYDLYDVGLVFFTAKRVKQHYIVNFL